MKPLNRLHNKMRMYKDKDEAKELIALAAKSITTLNNYGNHHKWCQAVAQGSTCDCGFEKVLGEILAEQQRLNVYTYVAQEA